MNIGENLPNEMVMALGVIAGLSSHVKTLETKISFPTMLATPTEKEKTSPPLSELRFQKIAKSRTPEDLYTNLRRAIHILKNKGNIPSITNGVLLWYKNRNNPAVNIQDTLLFQWSNDYFNTILKKETKSSK
jgi:CRISPR system Cascade subunit CasB